MKLKVFLILCMTRAACAALDPIDIAVTVNDSAEAALGARSTLGSAERIVALIARKDELYAKEELTSDELGELFEVAFKLKELRMNPINEMIERLVGEIAERKAYLERLADEMMANNERIETTKNEIKDIEEALRKLRTL